MTWSRPPLVGSPRARSLRGTSSGGTLVVLGAEQAPPRSARAGSGDGTDVGDGVDGPAELAADFDLTRRPVSGELPALLGQAAAIAASDAGSPLVLVAADLEMSSVGLLDVLDASDVTCAAVLDGASVADRRGAPAAVRVSEAGRQVVSVAAAGHVVTRPTGYAVGVLRVRAADRPALAAALSAAAAAAAAAEAAEAAQASQAAGARGGWGGAAPFDVALLAAVRAGVLVRAVTLSHQSVRRGDWQAPGAAGSAWQQRLRAASRGNDGLFSTVAIRPLSRRLTAYGLGRDWSPNVVTAVSLALGLAACAAVATGWWWAWLLGAVLLQASLVVDCVDGEIARFTRRSNPLGGWLDAVSDRVKEFTMVAALAWVAARRGSDLWWLAVLVLAVLAARHVEDHAYAMRRRAQLLGAPGWPEHPAVGGLGNGLRDGLGNGLGNGLGDELRDGSGIGDGGPEDAPTDVPAPPGARARRVRAIKQVLHLPIAERYLIMSVGLLTMSPAVVLWALGVASVIAFGWTQTGRLLRAVTRRDGFLGDRPDRQLADLCDLAVVPRPSGRGRLAWQVPALLLAIETAALLLAAGGDLTARAAAYAWLAVVCWHVYDNVYRLRETGRGSATWLRRGTGLEVRVVVLALIGGALAEPAPALLAGAVVLAALYVAESAVGWRAHLRPQEGRG
ncbi:CDP-alcohol phosphatidyltransferase-like enzyme [Humibacillus xanthopallidus]|uniref:CDP-alcohol phosphatidyltransferase-like enzyme n=1 Tax=Humibacillus xanthopallidus TaxID=412689 RepID=A0A543PX89_9MICO|nr:CDP-alcohol phosphatidyltransferase family protein [Humibacillus xanthopallidus]TQN48660.1 CDP-alcohol phosphatidyltransferase-like enzyme [Humibacillus xanthopallidus]